MSFEKVNLQHDYLRSQSDAAAMMCVNEATRLANQLIGALSKVGVRAERFATSKNVAGVIHYGLDGSLLVQVVLITTGGVGVHDFAWGPNLALHS